MEKKLTRGEKANYLRIAVALCGLGMDDKAADLIVITYEKLIKRGGNFNLHDAVKLKLDNDEFFAKKEVIANTKKETHGILPK